jgi:hypothetical protein
MKRLLVLPLLAAVALALAPRAEGQPGDDFDAILKTTPAPVPGTQPAPGARLPAGVQPATPAATHPAPAPNPYPLPADAGAWLICAAAYRGLDGPTLAKQVCEDLNKKEVLHKNGLRAYIYNRGDEERRQQDLEWERQKHAHPGVPLRRKMVRIVDHYAVLIAGWPDFESASKFLPQIKKLELPVLKLDGNRCAYDLMLACNTDPKTRQLTKVEKYDKVNPYANAMVTRHPLAPKEASKPKFDPIWTSLNEDEEYSLLKSRGKYTLLVKEFVGAREIQAQNGASKLFSSMGLGGSREGESLTAAAAQAHELARFLRKSLAVKAFVLHMRGSSVVTIGEFTGPNDPEMERMQRQLASLRFQGGPGGSDPIGLLPNPVAVEVPRP